MVASQTSKPAKDNRRYFAEALDKYFGRNDIALTKISRTVDGQGNITTQTPVTTTITGDLQYGTELDKRIVQLGIVKEGEGMLYVAWDLDIDPYDYITVDDEKWTIKTENKSPRMKKSKVHREYVVTRREE